VSKPVLIELQALTGYPISMFDECSCAKEWGSAMTTYVIATRREAQTSPSTAAEHVREVPGVRIMTDSNPHCISIEASEAAAAEIQRLFGSVLLIEPEIRAGPRPQDVFGSLPYTGLPKTLEDMQAGIAAEAQRRLDPSS
jgi:hypothetical protein